MQERKANEDQNSFRCAHSGNSLQTTNLMISEPLQKQIVPFTLEKCVIHIIWQITQILKWTAFPLSIQLLFIAMHLPRLGILKLMHQTCWLSCYSHVMKLLNFSDFREVFVGISLQQNQPGGSAHGLAPWKKGNIGSYTWVTLSWREWAWPCGLLGLLGSYLLFRVFCFAVYNTKTEPCWENENVGVFYSMYCF